MSRKGKIPVFDIGDTLLPSHEKINEKVREKVIESGVQNPPEFPINKYNIYVPDQVGEWLEKYGIEANAEEIKQAYIDWEEKFFHEKSLPALKKISEEYGPIGFVSDNSIEAKKFYRKIFEDAGIDYRGLVVSDEVGVKKPDPEIFRAFLDEREEKPEQFTYFGNYVERDSAAEKVGMNFVWVTQYHTFGSENWKPQIDDLTHEKVSEALIEVKK